MITLVYGEDRLGVYKDAVLVYSGELHVTPEQLLERLGLPVHSQSAWNYIDKHGDFPEFLTDVVMDV